MWPIVGLIAATAVTVVLEVPAMVRNRLKKDLAAFAILLAAGVGLSIAYALHIAVWNPVQLITRFFMPVSKWLDQLLS
ncbi:MAG: hypothetical protein K0R28_2330 [Paenibacillus sp.]|jgi:hypothetical protein|nr:hypothetical protein [Paenibacillus sp.]